MGEWVSEGGKFSNFSAISYRRQFNFQWDNDDEVRFVLDHHSELDFHSASSLKQQSADRHVRIVNCITAASELDFTSN
jgi:hypothetical protein